MGTNNEINGFSQYRTGFRFASKEEAKALSLSYTDYFSKLSVNDLEYKSNRKNTSLDGYKAYVSDQMLDFTDSEKAVITECVHRIEKSFELIGFRWNIGKDIVFVCTTARHEHGTFAFTHECHIYINRNFISQYGNSDMFDGVIAHEMCHVLTRNDLDFKNRLYKAVGFDREEKEPDFPDDIKKWIVKNPDVDSYNYTAEFTVGGKKIKAVIAIKYNSEYYPGASMMTNNTSVLIPYDTPDRFIPVGDVEDFYDVIGINTGYVIAADEVAAENFRFAVMSALDAKTQDPELTKSVLAVMRNR